MVQARAGRTISLAVGVLALASLSACTAPDSDPTETSPQESTSASPSATVVPDEPTAVGPFVLPSGCTALLAEIESELLEADEVLLLGSDNTGIYAGEFFDANQDVGTPLTCVFGKGKSSEYIEVDLQALTPALYEQALSSLEQHEFTESIDGEMRSFTLVGARSITAGVLHVVRPDSWISIVNFRGGTVGFAEIEEWLQAITALVHPQQ